LKGLYVHIPFCEYICHYCDFVKSVPKNRDVVDSYLVRLRDEINLYKDHFKSIETIYIGGGTPSMLSSDQLVFLLDSLKGIKPVEFSFEVNPESYTHEKGEILRKYGVNRISLGVQSFDDDILKYLNRGHHHEMVKDVIDDLKLLGFKYISIDLIFAIPGQTLDHIKRDLHAFYELGVTHLSYYSLILEDKTYFYHQYLRGKFKPIDEDLEASMYEYIIKDLKKRGFEQYEISNFAKDHHYSLHNSIYWTLGEYIGVGLGAHGFINNERTYNERSMAQYLEHFQKEKVTQTVDDLITDEMVFGLRMTRGVSISMMKEKYGIDVFERFPQIKEKIELGLLKQEGDRLHLTQNGMMLGNQVFMLFV